jgi:hypothetical protein
MCSLIIRRSEDDNTAAEVLGTRKSKSKQASKQVSNQASEVDSNSHSSSKTPVSSARSSLVPSHVSTQSNHHGSK